MSYEELKREISDRSISQLPGLLQHVARLCGIKPVFKDKESFLSFVGRAYDMGPAGGPKPCGACPACAKLEAALAYKPCSEF